MPCMGGMWVLFNVLTIIRKSKHPEISLCRYAVSHAPCSCPFHDFLLYHGPACTPRRLRVSYPLEMGEAKFSAYVYIHR